MPRLFKICSVVAHTIVVAWLVVAELLAVGPLPIPRVPLNFIGTMPITIVEPPAPPPRARETNPESNVSENAAPIVQPSSIQPETGREGAPERHDVGVISGVPDAGVGIGLVVLPPPPPPPPPPPQGPMRISNGMQPPRRLVNVDPVYPRVAQTARVEGVVILEATIDSRGRVMDVRVLRSVPLLDQAAVDAVRQWIYTPTLLNGVPVPVVMTVTLNFKLQDR